MKLNGLSSGSTIRHPFKRFCHLLINVENKLSEHFIVNYFLRKTKKVLFDLFIKKQNAKEMFRLKNDNFEI
jgi:hypothetical protein